MNNLIDAKELACNLDRCTIIDCRGDLEMKEYGCKVYETGHIPGAQLMNVDWLVKPACEHGGVCPLPDMEEFAKHMQELGIKKDKPVVVYGENNQISYVSRLWWMLKYIGIEDVRLLVGGMDQWKELDLPVTTEKTAVDIEKLDIDLKPEMVATIEDIYEAIETGDYTLLDARPPFKYAGTKDEPLAGHLPGAINVFFGRLFTEDGKVNEVEVKKIVKEIKDLNKPTVAYCNSGIAAQYISNILSDYGIYPKVYIGSLSDWMSYDGNTLVKGVNQDGNKAEK